MPKFMLILRGDPRDWTDLSPEDMQRIMGRYLAWGDELRAQGRTVSGDELQPSSSAQLTGAGDDFVVVDGPYTETKESVGGFWIISADDRADAIETAKGCPGFLHGGTVEVVEIIEHNE